MTRIMASKLAQAEGTTSPTLLELLPRFRRHLAAGHKAPKTITSYAEAVMRLHEFLTAQEMPTRVASITLEHVEAFQVDQLERLSAASAKTRYASLRQFFVWVVEDGELTENPMAGLKPPAVPEQPVPVLGEDELRVLLRTAEKPSDFLARRDAAILRVFIDTGARLSEISNLRVHDVNLENGTLAVMGKTAGEARPARAEDDPGLDRYLAVRDRHPDAADPKLWLGTQGPLTSNGVDLAARRRAKQAGDRGVPRPHPQALRRASPAAERGGRRFRHANPRVARSVDAAPLRCIGRR